MLDVLWRSLWRLHADQVSHAFHALQSTHRVVGGNFLVVKLHCAFQGDPTVRDDQCDAALRQRRIPVQRIDGRPGNFSVAEFAVARKLHHDFVGDRLHPRDSLCRFFSCPFLRQALDDTAQRYDPGFGRNADLRGVNARLPGELFHHVVLQFSLRSHFLAPSRAAPNRGAAVSAPIGRARLVWMATHPHPDTCAGDQQDPGDYRKDNDDPLELVHFRDEDPLLARHHVVLCLVQVELVVLSDRQRITVDHQSDQHSANRSPGHKQVSQRSWYASHNFPLCPSNRGAMVALQGLLLTFKTRKRGPPLLFVGLVLPPFPLQRLSCGASHPWRAELRSRLLTPQAYPPYLRGRLAGCDGKGLPARVSPVGRNRSENIPRMGESSSVPQSWDMKVSPER